MHNFLTAAIAEQIQRNFMAQTMSEEELKVNLQLTHCKCPVSLCELLIDYLFLFLLYTLQRTLIGFCRDLRGVALAFNNRTSYMMLFNWMYPQD